MNTLFIAELQCLLPQPPVDYHGDMSNEDILKPAKKVIIAAASSKLERELTDREQRFITIRGSFIALEAIDDTIRSESKEFIERYLNSNPT